MVNALVNVNYIFIVINIADESPCEYTNNLFVSYYYLINWIFFNIETDISYRTGDGLILFRTQNVRLEMRFSS